MTSNHPIIAIDPGLAGAVVVVSPHATPSIHSLRMPTWKPHRRKEVNGNAIVAFLRKVLGEQGVLPHHAHAVIEDVTPGAVASKASAFSFGLAFGLAQQAIFTLGISLQYVSASRWKRDMKLLKGTKQDSIDKATRIFGIGYAREHWPRKGDDGVAEAALIAAWCRQFG